MSNLILVDDHEIRKKAFASVDRLLQKLQRMEANLESYFSRDRQLFTEWVDLTFRESRRAIDTLRAEYRDLADFHNWMHALAEMEDLPLTEASLIIRDEIRLYEEGSYEVRQEIDRLRELREQFVRARLDQDQQRAQKRKAAREDDEEMNAARSPTLDPSDLEELEHLSDLTNDEIEDLCADTDVAHMFLGKILRVAGFTGDYALFFRVWDLLHPKTQKSFSRQFEKKTGVSLFDVIEEMREKVGEDEASAPMNDRESVAEPEKVETLKLLYRQLARKLHPDMNISNNEADWRKAMWLRVQAAYKAEDKKELTKLFHLVLLRGCEWQSLRISELQITHEWLSDEISATNDYLKDLRRQPAWGFSRRKNFDPIAKKISKQMANERKRLEEQVAELRTHHSFLERMGRSARRR